MLEGVWYDLVIVIVGGGLLSAGIFGLATDGSLPPFKVPDTLKPLFKFGLVVALFIGLTMVLDRGTPDLAQRVVAALL